MPRLSTLKPRLTKAMVETHQPKSRWGQGRGGRPWTRKREAVLLRDKYTCQHCQRVYQPRQLECDHKINKAQGGSDELSNLQTLCIDCHKVKTHKESEQGKYNHNE